MFYNCKKVKFFTVFFITVLFSTQNIFSKNNKGVFEKKVHPRVYEFDLCDSLNTIFLGLSKERNIFECNEIDFTRFVKNDLPQEGDVIKFYFNGYATNDAGTLYAQIYDSNLIETLCDDEQIMCENLTRNTPCEGIITFHVDYDSYKGLHLYIYSDKKNKAGIDQVFFKFKRVIKSTDTVKEKAEEEKAIRKNLEIVEVKINPEEYIQEVSPVIAEEETSVTESNDEEDLTVKEDLAVEEKVQSKTDENLNKEDEKAALQSAELEKALQLARKNKSSYGKEYLSDYMIPEEDEFETEEEDDGLIENPNKADVYGRTLLMKAAKAGNDWQIRTLLNSGADVNIKDKDGWTALMYAVRYQESLNTVNILLDSGADIKALNNFKTSSLALASCYNNNPEIIKRLLQAYNPSDKEVLKSFVLLLTENQSSEYTQISKINIYIQANVPVNNFYNGKTPLMYACEFGNSTKVIKVLLDNNAVPSLRSTEGKTAYEYASENKKLAHDSTYWELNKK